MGILFGIYVTIVSCVYLGFFVFIGREVWKKRYRDKWITGLGPKFPGATNIKVGDIIMPAGPSPYFSSSKLVLEIKTGDMVSLWNIHYLDMKTQQRGILRDLRYKDGVLGKGSKENFEPFPVWGCKIISDGQEYVHHSTKDATDAEYAEKALSAHSYRPAKHIFKVE